MKPLPPHLREEREPPARPRDMLALVFLFIVLPIGIAATIWWFK